MEEAMKITVREKLTLKKYDGDPPQPGEAKEPAEIITVDVVNGEEVGRTVERPGQ